jgi:hypothetical protein
MGGFMLSETGENHARPVFQSSLQDPGSFKGWRAGKTAETSKGA